MQIDYNVGVPMRDGTRLSALVCRPQGNGPFPAVLWRSCYTKWRMPLAERGPFWTAAGYALVLQDVRGSGDSDGEFYPLIQRAAGWARHAGLADSAALERWARVHARWLVCRLDATLLGLRESSRAHRSIPDRHTSGSGPQLPHPSRHPGAGRRRVDGIA